MADGIIANPELDGRARWHFAPCSEQEIVPQPQNRDIRGRDSLVGNIPLFRLLLNRGCSLSRCWLRRDS